ncbi:hypothetical protein [Burkholderia pseudomallei]|uniref:hypothetical protein n=1 Tax=Burkholderia pseudomallei TaxID=28450 RepID=UPI0005727626|nr:hypothetical protein [Burkholderia pseudomallei]
MKFELHISGTYARSRRAERTMTKHVDREAQMPLLAEKKALPASLRRLSSCMPTYRARLPE